jgi:hypothetical protein
MMISQRFQAELPLGYRIFSQGFLAELSSCVPTISQRFQAELSPSVSAVFLCVVFSCCFFLFSCCFRIIGGVNFANIANAVKNCNFDTVATAVKG